ncbi:MAG TPA: AI-2E family transporter [Clostridiales bacterium]|nr:AI-2E family transporter [Clostridiales bacterium]
MNGGLDILQLISSKPILYFLILTFIITNIFVLVLLGGLNYYLIHIGNRYVESTKKIELRKKYIKYFFLIIGVFLIFSIIYHFRNTLWSFFSPVVWAVLLAYLLNPITNFIQKKFNISTGWSVIVLYIVIFFLLVFFSMIAVPHFTKEIRNLIKLLPRYTSQANQILNEIYINIEKIDRLSPQLTTVKEMIIENIALLEQYILSSIAKITEAIFGLFSRIFNFILVPVFTFYFLKDKIFIKEKIQHLIPISIRQQTIELFADIHVVLNKFIRGELTLALIVAILSTIALMILRVNFAILLGIIAGIFEIIPYFGPVIGAIPAIVIALLDQPLKALWVAIAFVIIQQVESNIIAPKIVGESVGLHPVIVVLVLLAGGRWFGMMGMLLAVPFAASIRIVLKHLLIFITKIR